MIFFLLDSKLLPNVIDSKYHNILISDHAPTSVILDFNIPKQSSTWRLQPYLLNDSNFCKYLSQKIEEFSQTNDTMDTSDSVLWETFKVVLRGHIISYEASQKKMRDIRLKDIDDKISKLETSYRQNNCNLILQEITNLKYEYNTILTKQVSSQMSRLRVRYFELGDKPHTLLARQLRGQQNSRAIHRIKSNTGGNITLPKSINECFANFYTELYRSKAQGDGDSWHKEIPIPRLDDSSRDTLNQPLSIKEVLNSIRAFSSGKTPGSDGYGAEFYKKFAVQISPLLLRMLTH